MKCLATATKAFLTAAILQCLAPLAYGGTTFDKPDGPTPEPEDSAVLRELRGLPTELRDLCISYVLYRFQAEDAGLQLYHPEMFSSHVQWDRFETKHAGPHIRITEGGKAAGRTTEGYGWSTARAAEWVSSSGRASGTLTWLCDGGELEIYTGVGIILRGQRDMGEGMWSSGTSWYYIPCSGSIHKASPHRSPGVHNEFILQEGLAKINTGDKITVVVKDGQLSFEVNGTTQGTPVDLPEDTEVTMAVSLWREARVRLD